MIIDCISDLHGHYPELPGGDLLIVAGDLTAKDKHSELIAFGLWLEKQKYTKKVFIAGNHDNKLMMPNVIKNFPGCDYLCDSGTEFEGLKIWGSPWTKTFEGMNPHCKAFTCDTEEELYAKFSSIPYDIDILVTHSPPYTILDKTIRGEHVGSKYLYGALEYYFRPKLWVFGHIHEGYGQETFKEQTIIVNASHVNERYEPVNPPIRIVL